MAVSVLIVEDDRNIAQLLQIFLDLQPARQYDRGDKLRGADLYA